MDLEAIWHDYRVSLTNFLRTKISDPSDVEDVLQEILIKTHANLGSIKTESSVKSWLFQVARNAAIDFYRRERRPSPNPEDLWYAIDQPDILDDLTGCLKPFIDRLPEKEAHILTAIELKGVSQKDYAKQIRVPYSTLKSRVNKSRALLRHLYEECCTFSLDAQGNVMDCSENSGKSIKC
ncbi:MAG: RNA polymerase sigma factor SigZ [Sneathiella sp.]